MPRRDPGVLGVSQVSSGGSQTSQRGGPAYLQLVGQVGLGLAGVDGGVAERLLHLEVPLGLRHRRLAQQLRRNLLLARPRLLQGHGGTRGDTRWVMGGMLHDGGGVWGCCVRRWGCWGTKGGHGDTVGLEGDGDTAGWWGNQGTNGHGDSRGPQRIGGNVRKMGWGCYRGSAETTW